MLERELSKGGMKFHLGVSGRGSTIVCSGNKGVKRGRLCVEPKRRQMEFVPFFFFLDANRKCGKLLPTSKRDGNRRVLV